MSKSCLVFGNLCLPPASLPSDQVYRRTTYYCTDASLWDIVSTSASASTWTTFSPSVLTFTSARLSDSASTSDSACIEFLDDYKFSILLAFVSPSVSTSEFPIVSPSVFITNYTWTSARVSKSAFTSTSVRHCPPDSVPLRFQVCLLVSQNLPVPAGQPVLAIDFYTILLAVFSQVY